MKETLRVIPSATEKIKNKKRRLRNADGSEEEDGPVETATSNVTKKKLKKIKIRLADPNLPDSYVCEIFDSSLETENSFEEETSPVQECVNTSMKPKNFFEVLMSHESRRNFTVNTAVQNETIPEETKLLRKVEDEVEINNRKMTKEKNKGRLLEMLKKKAQTGVNDHCTDDSDDETLFQVQSKMRVIKSGPKIESITHYLTKRTADEVKGDKENKITELKEDASTGNPTKKKNSKSIAHYFSKTGGCTTKNNVKPKLRKLTEIDMFESVSNAGVTVEPELLKKRSFSKVADVPLAPLFRKKLKTVIDPEVKKARMEFLLNGLPTNLKKPIQKPVESPYSLFPVVSHIRQWGSEESAGIIESEFPLSLTQIDEDYVYESERLFRFKVEDVHLDSNSVVKPAEKCTFENLRKKFNFESIYKGLKAKNEDFKKKGDRFRSAAKKRKRKKSDHDDSIEIVEDDAAEVEFYNTVWTEKYRPKSWELIGNKQTVAKVSEWLKSWKDYDNEIQRLSKEGVKFKKNQQSCSVDNSDDDFVSSDEENFGLRTPGNVCILTGPVSSGKTALVYALASELEFNVLEVNSSSKRTGKKLMLDLQEATRSHKVSSGFSHGPVKGTEEKGRKMKVKKKRRKRESTEVGSSENRSNNFKISLILIEDADVYFEEHDEGFISGISTLVQSSKRPFIFLANEANVGYLEKFKAQQALVLKMKRPDLYNSALVLQAIASLEGSSVSCKDVRSIIEGNRCDLRKSILELQFWIESGRSLNRGDAEFSLQAGKLWWGLNSYLYGTDRLHRVNFIERKKENEFYDSSEVEDEAEKAEPCFKKEPEKRMGDARIREYSRFLDAIVERDLFGTCRDDSEPIPSRQCTARDSVSLNESMESADWIRDDLSGSIARELVKVSGEVFRKRLDSSRGMPSFGYPSWEEIRWRNQQEEAKRELVSLTPMSGTSMARTVNLDYLPFLRNMCRTERNRQLSNTKRKNRFYHYIRSIGADVRDETLDFWVGALRGIGAIYTCIIGDA